MARGTGIQLKIEGALTSEWEDRLTAHLKAESGRLAYNTARKVQMFAKQRVPQPPGIAPRTPWAQNSPSGYVRTGRLRRSIRREKVAPGKHVVIADTPYARYVEYGTRYMIAQPFMAPSIRKARTELRKTKKGLLVFRRKRVGKTGP